MQERVASFAPGLLVTLVDDFCDAGQRGGADPAGCQLRYRRHRPGARQGGASGALRVRGLPVLVCGGAGGRPMPSRLCDLALTAHDAALSKLTLRREYALPARDKSFASPPSTNRAAGGRARGRQQRRRLAGATGSAI